MKYKEVYRWNVETELRNGASVKVVDKQKEQVYDISEMMVDEYIDLMNAADKDNDRYYFYKEAKEGTEA